MLNEELKIIWVQTVVKNSETPTAVIWLRTYLFDYFDFNSILFKKAVIWTDVFSIFLLILWKMFIFKLIIVFKYI
jgi:hypothetical protein